MQICCYIWFFWEVWPEILHCLQSYQHRSDNSYHGIQWTHSMVSLRYLRNRWQEPKRSLRKCSQGGGGGSGDTGARLGSWSQAKGGPGTKWDKNREESLRFDNWDLEGSSWRRSFMNSVVQKWGCHQWKWSWGNYPWVAYSRSPAVG